MKPKTIAILLCVFLLIIIVLIVGFATKNDIKDVQPATAPVGITSAYQTEFETSFEVKATENTQQSIASEPITFIKSDAEPTEKATVYTSKQEQIDKAIDSISISIDGTELLIPSPVSDINSSFELSKDNKKKELKYNEVDNPCVYRQGDTKGDLFVLHIKNTNTKTLPYSKCEVNGVEFDVQFLEKTDVSFSNLGEIKSLTLEKLEREMGVANDKNIIDNVVVCNYSPDNSGKKSCSFTFVDNKLSRVEVHKSE